MDTKKQIQYILKANKHKPILKKQNIYQTYKKCNVNKGATLFHMQVLHIILLYITQI